METRILVADDQALIRNGIVSILKGKYPDWHYFEAGDGMEAYNLAVQHEPALVLMDYNMPRVNGLDSIRMIRGHLSGTKFIMVYGDLTDEVIMKALSAGVQGFVVKEYQAEELLEAIEKVLEGRHYMMGRIFDLARMSSEAKTWKKDSPPSFFSPRETEVLKLIFEGKTSREIAGILHISKRTVDRHRINMLARSGVKTTVELIRFSLNKNIS